MFSKKTTLFCDPGIKYPSLTPQLTFENYINTCKQLIANTRLDLTSDNKHIIIEANAPFEEKPSTPTKKGALLIHGLFDSPFIMRDIANHLKNQRLWVRAVLLPGQGTVPGSLLNVDYQQWIDTVAYGVESLNQVVEDVFLIGFSTGASLALEYALRHPNTIKGLILLSPALKIRSAFDFMSNWYRIFLKCSPRVAWFHLDEEEMIDYAKYRSVPFNAVYQVFRLANALRKLPPTAIPLFMAIAEMDETIHSQTAITYFLTHTQPLSRLVLYTAHARRFSDPRVVLKSVVYPEYRIVNFSHSCLPISPHNTHYGLNGDYPYASRANPRMIYGNFSPLTVHLNRFALKCHVTQQIKARLTFNPDFEHLAENICTFIKNLH